MIRGVYGSRENLARPSRHSRPSGYFRIKLRPSFFSTPLLFSPRALIFVINFPGFADVLLFLGDRLAFLAFIATGFRFVFIFAFQAAHNMHTPSAAATTEKPVSS